MCGIAGIVYDIAASGPDPVTLRKMIQVLRHRGPDECGIFMDDQVGLAHDRLSIIDLSSGVQPIHNEDKSLWIVYNGEVFNYPQLREDLEKKGHRFYTTTDTEVVLHLFEEMGKLAKKHGLATSTNRVGSMGCLFFTDQEVVEFDSAQSCDTQRFASMFCSMLQRGVYLAPSQFEAAFVSLAHDQEDIDKTLAAADEVFREI